MTDQSQKGARKRESSIRKNDTLYEALSDKDIMDMRNIYFVRCGVTRRITKGRRPIN